MLRRCVVLGRLPSIGGVDVGAPVRLPSVLLPSISVKARSTIGSVYDGAPKGLTRPAMGAAGSAEDTAGLRSGRSRLSSARGTLILASGCWVGEGSAARREEKGQEAGRLRTYLVHESRLHFSRAGVAVRFDSIMFHPTLSRRCRRATPRSGHNRPNPRPTGTTMRSPSSVFGL